MTRKNKTGTKNKITAPVSPPSQMDTLGELNRRNADLTNLIKVIKLISSSLEREKIVKVVLSESARMFGLNKSWFLSFAEQGRNTVVISACYGSTSLSGNASAKITGLFSKIFKRQFKPIIIRQGEGRGKEAAIPAALGVKLIAIIPEIVGGKPAGILCLGSTSSKAKIHPDQIPLLITLAHQVGIALENARLFEQKLQLEREMEIHNKEQSMLLQLSRILAASPELEGIDKKKVGVFSSRTVSTNPIENIKRILTDAAKLIRSFLDVETVIIRMRNSETHGFRPIASVNTDSTREYTIPEEIPERKTTPYFFTLTSPLAVDNYETTHTVIPLQDIVQDRPIKSLLSIPLIYRDIPVGILSAYTCTYYKKFNDSEKNLFTAIAAQISLSLMNAMFLDDLARHKSDLERLSKDLISAQEEERKRISRELHDEAGQSLYALRLGLELLKEKSRPAGKEATDLVEDQLRNVTHTIENIRRISYDLRPTLIDDLGLVPAIRYYVDSFEKRTGIPVILKMDMHLTKLDGSAEVNIYRIIQEALTNVYNHSGAKKVTIQLHESKECLKIEIKDDGTGFSSEAKPKGRGIGLIGMKERITLLGGSLFVYSLRGKGTTLNIEIPLQNRR